MKSVSKGFEYDKQEVLNALSVIENDNRLTELFRKKYSTEFDMARICLNSNWIKVKAVKYILRIAKLKDAPTYQTRNPKTFDKLKEVINSLSSLDNGDCIDGETMEYLIKQIGFEEYLLRSLFLKASSDEIKILLEERKELNMDKIIEVVGEIGIENKANNYLIDSDEANVSEQIEIIKKNLVENPHGMIDHLDGVQTVEQFEYTFTVKDFLQEIGVID